MCLRDQNFIYFSQYKLKDIQKQSQLKHTIASPKIQRHQPKHKNNMDTTQNNVHVQRYDRVLTQQKDNKQEKTQKEKMQKKLKTRTVKNDPELYEYAAYARSECTVQGTTEKM